MSLKVGDKLFRWNVYRGLESFLIVGESTFSWMLSIGKKEVRVRKSDLTSAGSRHRIGQSREQFYSKEGWAAHSEEIEWRNNRLPRILETIKGGGRDIQTKVHALLVSEGVLKSEEPKNG